MRIPKRVAVIGAGSMGSQAMWRLAARGAEVIGYDRYAPGHDRGAAGGESRIYRAAHLGEPGYIPLLRLADRMWEQLQAETGLPLRRRSGSLVMGEAASPSMRLLLSTSAAQKLDHEVLDREELARRYPQHRLPDGHTAVLDRLGAVIRPEASIQAAAARAEQLGARLHRYTTVREVVPAAGGGVRVVTDQGTDHVDAAVVTVGPWINTLLPDSPGPSTSAGWSAPGTCPPATTGSRAVPLRSCAPHPTTASESRRPTASPSSSVSPSNTMRRCPSPNGSTVRSAPRNSASSASSSVNSCPT